MKYFQNVVTTVRDLIPDKPVEKPYKSGMRPDKDGFMDVTWCEERIINSWEELCKASRLF